MIVYPAMDLVAGRPVRLTQGRFDEATVYSGDPAEALRSFAEAGARWAHVVDLDGARLKCPAQHDLIASLALTSPLQLQVGGGFRTRDEIAAMLDAGIARVLIGSLAVRQPEQVSTWLDEFGPERIALALDVRMVGTKPIVAISGWTEATGLSLWEVAAFYPTARHLVLTDISKDGMLSGPNFDLLDEASRRLPNLQIQASGGISSLEDIERLRTDGVIIGKALWEGRVTLQEVLSLACA